MGKIVISTNSTVDGVVQVGDWFDQVVGEDRPAWAGYFAGEATAGDALLLGRRSDEWFAARWLDRTGEWAERLNGMPKFVVSSTLERTVWSNGTVVTGDLAEVVAGLKREFAGDILVYGSSQLCQALFERGLVDEIRLMVLPVVVGEGARLFGTADGMRRLRLVDSTTVGKGIVSVTYEVVKEG